MIAITLYGGLGNQMFLYAAARAAALRNKTDVVFNLKQGFIDDKLFHRHLELQHFVLDLPEAGIATFDIPFGKYVRFISRKLGFNILCPKIKFVSDNEIPSGSVCNLKNAYLEGYWAGDIYFEDFSDTIRKDFTIKKGYINQPLKDELNQIVAQGGVPIMVGVRRYQECASSSDIPMGGLGEDKDYYLRAMDFIADRVENPVFWVFSQAQQWFRENVDDGKYNVVYANQKNGKDSAIEDMYLMTQCQHAIISFSTYYWWAAWLIENKNKIVICPSTYENRKTMCKDWVCLK